MPGEFDLIDWIRTQQFAGGIVELAAGDDLAVLKWPRDDLLLVGVDQVLDGVHFDSAVHEPRLIGRKVMNRNLSDCAAMACLPAAAVVSVALPKGYGLEQAQQLYDGIRLAAELCQCPIVGGETGSWQGPLAVTVAILGRSYGITPVLRSGAQAEDGVFVTGPLGGSLLGRHMTFEPRVHLARALAAGAAPIHAMIDLSDGLSRDLRHICTASGVGAVIDSQAIPVHEDAQKLAHRDGRSPLEHALDDGEDYELLFTSPATPAHGTRIGTIVKEQGMWLQQDGTRVALDPRGWEHNL